MWIFLGSLLLFFLIFGGALWLALQQAKKAEANLTALAARQGLELQKTKSGLSTTVEVFGVREGRAVRFWAYHTGSGKSRQSWVAVSVRPNAGGLKFVLSGQGFGSKVMEFFGQKEITVGDPAFDAVWFIRTNQPEYFAAALVPEIRENLTHARVAGAKGTFKREDGPVTYTEHGFLSSEKTLAKLESLLPVLTDLAITVEVSASA